MRQFIQLFCFEWKKIWKRKGTWITLGILLAFHIGIESMGLFTCTYIEGEPFETRVQASKTDAQNGRKLSGRKLDDGLLQEMQTAYQKYADEDDRSYMLTEDYQKSVRPYSMIYETMNIVLWGYDIDLMTVTQEQFYEARAASVRDSWDSYRLTSAERAYWQEKEDNLSEPFTYQYAKGYDYLINMSGVYMVCMLLTFLIAICMSAVFTEEHGRKTDQLILCTRLGRKQVYFAKILAGSMFTLASAAILLLVSIAYAFILYGADGFDAAIQLYTSCFSEKFTIGQVFLIMTGILFLSSLLMCIFTMVFSEITSSNVAAMAFVIAAMFLARLIMIPAQYRVLSQAWNYFPINLLKFNQGFWDKRLVSILGLKLTSWEFTPILYILLIIVFVFAGKKVYCSYQIKGR